jgi:4-hydroxymandelate oxidase
MDMEKIGDSRVITRKYYDSLLLEMRHLDSIVPDTSFEVFGEKFTTPIMTAALSHLGKSREDSLVAMAEGAKEAGALMWCGMGPEEQLEEIVATGAKVVKIIKPYADRELIYKKIAHCRDCGALALGMDIDHQFSRKGTPDVVLGSEMAPVSTSELRDFIAASQLPFVVKGILSVTDAVKCADAGAAAIVISHHNSIMDYSVPTLYILPEIVKAVGGRMKIFVDCGVQSGMDAFKALALGADAVSVGKELMGPLSEQGAKGVAERIRSLTQELAGVMVKTCTHDIPHVDPTLIHRI